MSAAPITLKAVFNRKNSLNAQGEALLQIRATKGRNQIYFSTGIYLKPEQWNDTKGEVAGHPDKYQLNRTINSIKKHLQTLEERGRTGNPDYSTADLKADYKPDQKEFSHFSPFALCYLEKEKDGLAKSTYTKYKNSITTFQEFAKGRDTFGKITPSLIDDFIQRYLPGKGNAAAANTQEIYLRHLKKYEAQAIEDGYLKAEQAVFGRYNKDRKKIRTTTPRREWLEAYEVKKLEAFEIPADKAHWGRIRDFYLFMCYTGLRFGDAASIGRKNIKETPEGLELLTTAQKTSKKFTLPLYLLFDSREGTGTKPERLIKKYWREDSKPFFSTTKTGGGQPNNQHVNREIKHIAEAAGIVGKSLTNHTARHTFASFLITRVPITVVRDLLQHGKIETTMIYAHQSNGTINQHLKNIIDWS